MKSLVKYSSMCSLFFILLDEVACVFEFHVPLILFLWALCKFDFCNLFGVVCLFVMGSAIIF